jgi:uncharacterized protein YaaQ
MVQRLITAIIQMRDADAAIGALHRAGFSVSRMSSSGGFLGKWNVTLLIGIEEGQVEQVQAILAQICRKRIEYVATPVEGSPFHLPLSTPVTVGGATIFSMPVERYEEF